MDHKTANIIRPKDPDNSTPDTAHERHHNINGERLSSQDRGGIPQEDPEDRGGSKGKDKAPPCVHHAQGRRIHTPDRKGAQQAVLYRTGLAHARHADGHTGQVRRDEAGRNPED